MLANESNRVQGDVAWKGDEDRSPGVEFRPKRRSVCPTYGLPSRTQGVEAITDVVAGFLNEGELALDRAEKVVGPVGTGLDGRLPLGDRAKQLSGSGAEQRQSGRGAEGSRSTYSPLGTTGVISWRDLRG